MTEDMKKTLDEAMAHFARVTSETLENDYMNTPGAGAAGGLGYAFLAYTGAALTPGIELILDAVGLEEELPDLQKNIMQRLSHLQEASQKKRLPATKKGSMHFSLSYAVSAHLRKLWILSLRAII